MLIHYEQLHPVRERDMEHKAWRWSRRTSEKTIVANGRAILDGDEDNDNGSSRCPSNLSERFCDCPAKEEKLSKYARMAEEAVAGKEMAEAEAALLKQELNKAVLQGEAAEERLCHLEAALRECMQEIESLQGQQDERLKNAISKGTQDFDKAQKKLEGKLAESNKRVLNLSAENTNLMKALLCKEKLIEDLDKGKAQLEAEFDMLMARLDSAQEDNTFLKYRCCSMEEELELLNEETEYSKRSALENARQIKKLEAECQELRNLIRKRLQGPMMMGNFSEKPSKGTSFLVQRVYQMEEENKTLRDILTLNDSELQSWRARCCQMASQLAEVEAQLKHISENGESGQLALPGFELSNSDRIGDSESWASALLAELEHFRKGQIRNQPESRALELTGNNDLLEAEKYALVATGMDGQAAENQLQSTSKELVLQRRESWLDEVLNLILEEHRVSKRSFSELLQDIEIVLGCKDGMSMQKEESSSNISGLLPWKSQDPADVGGPTLKGTPSNCTSVIEKGQNIKDASFTREKIRKHFGSDRSKSDIQLVSSPNSHNTLAQMIKIQSVLQEENRRMKKELESVMEENEGLRKHLQESDQNIARLKTEVEALREVKGVMEDQMENQRLINEDLDTQLTVAKAKLNEILHKLSSLEVELEDKNNCCEELEATCLELQLQLETISRKETPDFDIDQMAKKLTTESIQQWGKQLRALPSPDNMALIPTTKMTETRAPASHKRNLAPQRSSLRDRMMADDNDKQESQDDLQKPQSFNPSDVKALPAPEVKVRSSEQTMAIVPSKKQGGGFGFVRKLFLRRKTGCSKMKTISLQRNASQSIRQRDVLLVA